MMCLSIMYASHCIHRGCSVGICARLEKVGDREISWFDCTEEGESEELMDVESIWEKGEFEQKDYFECDLKKGT